MKQYRKVSTLGLMALLSLGLNVVLPVNSSHALSLNIISEPALLSRQDALFGVSIRELPIVTGAVINLVNEDISEDKTFTVVTDPGTGKSTVHFGDGQTGNIPPTGSDPTVAAYRYGTGSAGTVLEPFLISLSCLPVFIPLDDPSTGEEETDIRFFLAGIGSFEFEVTGDGAWITAIRAVPEPAALLIFWIGLIGLAGLRRRFDD